MNNFKVLRQADEGHWILEVANVRYKLHISHDLTEWKYEDRREFQSSFILPGTPAYQNLLDAIKSYIANQALDEY